MSGGLLLGLQSLSVAEDLEARKEGVNTDRVMDTSRDVMMKRLIISGTTFRLLRQAYRLQGDAESLKVIQTELGNIWRDA